MLSPPSKCNSQSLSMYFSASTHVHVLARGRIYLLGDAKAICQILRSEMVHADCDFVEE